MRNRIKSMDFPALLLKIHQDRREGLLLIKHHASKHGIFFQDGKVIHAFTSREDLKLESYLKEKGFVDQEKLEEILSNGNGRNLGPALVESGLVSESMMRHIMNSLTTDIVVYLFSLPEFKIHFEGKTYKPAYAWHAELYIPNLIIKGVRQIAGWSVIFKELRRGKLRIRPSTSILEYFKRLDLSAEEGFLLSRINGDMTLTQILHLSHLEEELTLRSVYGLLAAGVLDRCRSKRTEDREKTAVENQEEIDEIRKIEDLVEDLESLAEIEAMSRMESEQTAGQIDGSDSNESPSLATMSLFDSVPGAPAPETLETAKTESRKAATPDRDEAQQPSVDETPVDLPAFDDEEPAEKPSMTAAMEGTSAQENEGQEDQLGDTNKIPTHVVQKALEMSEPPQPQEPVEKTEKAESTETKAAPQVPHAAQERAPDDTDRLVITEHSSVTQKETGAGSGDQPGRPGTPLTPALPGYSRQAGGNGKAAAAKNHRSAEKPDGLTMSAAGHRGDRNDHEAVLRAVADKNSMTCQEIRLAFTG